MGDFVKDTSLAGKITTARIARRLNVIQLARRAGLHQQTLYRIEKGLAFPSMKTMRALDEVFGEGWDKAPAA